MDTEGTATNDNLESDIERARTALGDTLQQRRDPFIGKIIGERYHVLSLIGTGGWGRVYEVEHTLLQNRLAMKVLHSSHTLDDDKVIRFKREAQALVALDHHNVARVSDFTVGEDGQFCIMMELLKGSSLAQELEAQGTLSPDEALNIGLQVCDGLSAAHAKHIVHRDVKPDNIYICRDEQERPQVKVIDFGLASMRGDESSPSLHLTATGETIGTPPYMSPEQCRGRSADARTDVYALGCVLYEALTGKKAFCADNVLDTMMLHVEGVVEPLVKANPKLKDWQSLQTILDKALAVDATDRYQSIADLAEDLKTAREGKPIEKRSSLQAKWRKLKQRKSPTVLVFLFGCATVSLVMMPIVLGRRFDYQMFMFRAMFVFMVWAIVANFRKMFSSRYSAAEKVAARWGALGYLLMLPNAFCFVTKGLVSDEIRHPLAQVVYNPLYVRVSIVGIVVSMFLSFWILKRAGKNKPVDA